MPTAISSSQHTISNCAFAVQRHTVFDTDTRSDIESLKPVSPDILPTTTNQIDEDSENFTTSHENTTVTSNVTSTILLKTAKTVASSANKKLMARIFFDEGSQRSYVRTAFANKLNLAPTTYEYLTVHGFGGKVTEHSYGVTDIGLETPSGIENVRVLITDEIVQPLQQYCLTDLKSYPRFRDLPLVNDYKDNSFTVDILLGADAAYRFLGNVSQENSHPLIQESKFGYVLSGPLQLNSKPTCQSEPHGQDISSITTSESCDNASTISFENLMSNTTLFHQTNRLFQDQFVSKSPPSTENSTFLHSYRQKIEFRNGSYYAPLLLRINIQSRWYKDYFTKCRNVIPRTTTLFYLLILIYNSPTYIPFVSSSSVLLPLPLLLLLLLQLIILFGLLLPYLGNYVQRCKNTNQ